MFIFWIHILLMQYVADLVSQLIEANFGLHFILVELSCDLLKFIARDVSSKGYAYTIHEKIHQNSSCSERKEQKWNRIRVTHITFILFSGQLVDVIRSLRRESPLPKGRCFHTGNLKTEIE